MDRSQTERLTYLFSARSDKVRVIEGVAVSVDRNQYFIESGLQWLVTQNSTVNLSYRYNNIRYLSEADHAHSNAVTLTFTQAWRKISISR